MVALLDRTDWLAAAQAALRRSAETDNPDLARILCYTNRSLEQLVPIARRALHGEMADQLPVLPGEVLITRSAVMGPACREGDDAGEEPDMVLGSNREVVVRDVTPERCDLADLGLAALPGIGVPVIETLTATVEAGETEMNLRLLPWGRTHEKRLMACWRGCGNRPGMPAKKMARPSGGVFLVRDAFASLGRLRFSPCIAAREAPLGRCLSMATSFGPATTSCGVNWCTWRSAAPARRCRCWQRDGPPPMANSGANGSKPPVSQLGLQTPNPLPTQVDRQADAHQAHEQIPLGKQPAFAVLEQGQHPLFPHKQQRQ